MIPICFIWNTVITFSLISHVSLRNNNNRRPIECVGEDPFSNHIAYTCIHLVA